MAIRAANTTANLPSNKPVQENNERPRQEQPNVNQSPESRENSRDDFVQSPESGRLIELNDRKEELQGEVNTIAQSRNEREAEFAQGAEIRREINDIDREIKNIERPENEAANRVEREALNQYAEQNQTVVRTRNMTQGITNMQGE